MYITIKDKLLKEKVMMDIICESNYFRVVRIGAVFQLQERHKLFFGLSYWNKIISFAHLEDAKERFDDFVVKYESNKK